MEKRGRPSWDEYFMFNAFWIATRSSCCKLHTGTIIEKDKRIISAGYNGAPPGIVSCLERGCRKDEYKIDFNDKGRNACRGIHAEINALSQISRQELQGSTLYSVFFPCTPCAKAIVGNGIKRVVYNKIYEEEGSLAQELFHEKGIVVEKLDFDIEKYFDFINKINQQS
jgi:dCMP deaminase